jgi:hypothetical protein
MIIEVRAPAQAMLSSYYDIKAAKGSRMETGIRGSYINNGFTFG